MLNSLYNISEKAPQNVWRSYLSSGECKTHSIVSLEQCLRVEDVACQVVDINTHKSIRLTRVATDSDQFRVFRDCINSVKVEA